MTSDLFNLLMSFFSLFPEFKYTIDLSYIHLHAKQSSTNLLNKLRNLQLNQNCRFQVSHHSKQIEIKIKTVQLSPESGKRKKVYTQSPSPRFRSQQCFLSEMRGEMFYPNLQKFVWRRQCGAHLDGQQHGDQKPTETSVTEFCYKKRDFISRETQ